MPSAQAAVFELTYGQLRRIARGLMRRERPEHTLQPTELVLDVWLKLVDPFPDFRTPRRGKDLLRIYGDVLYATAVS